MVFIVVGHRVIKYDSENVMDFWTRNLSKKFSIKKKYTVSVFKLSKLIF